MHNTKCTVSIIGTAGRKDDTIKMTSDLFKAMVSAARHTICETWKLLPQNVHLVSGGAAWSDHVAVALYLQSHESTHSFGHLTLHLPCTFDETNVQALETKTQSWKENPGYLMNLHHRQMSTKVGYSTLKELLVCKQHGATFETSNGFHARNRKVAASQYVLAFTWGETTVKDGGTKYTWDLASTKTKLHIPLRTLSLVTPLAKPEATPMAKPLFATACAPKDDQFNLDAKDDIVKSLVDSK